jgi:hypothetical protein
MVIPARHNNSKDILRERYFILRCDRHKTKVYTNLFAYFQNSDFLIVQTAVFLMFTYSDTELLHFNICHIALYAVITSCLLCAKNHHHGTRLIFISLNVLCSTIFQTKTTELNDIYVSYEKQFFIQYATFKRGVVEHCVPYINLIQNRVNFTCPLPCTFPIPS